MQRSFIWQFLYPIRFFEDMIRFIRRTYKTKKRLEKNYG
jgi:hypothetical protein